MKNHIEKIIMIARQDDLDPQIKAGLIQGLCFFHEYVQGYEEGYRDATVSQTNAKSKKPDLFQKLNTKDFVFNTYKPSLS